MRYANFCSNRYRYDILGDLFTIDIDIDNSAVLLIDTLFLSIIGRYFSKCRYIDCRYFLSIYCPPLSGDLILLSHKFYFFSCELPLKCTISLVSSYLPFGWVILVLKRSVFVFIVYRPIRKIKKNQATTRGGFQLFIGPKKGLIINIDIDIDKSQMRNYRHR